MKSVALLVASVAVVNGVWVAREVVFVDNKVDSGYNPSTCENFAKSCKGSTTEDIDCSFKDKDVYSYTWEYHPPCQSNGIESSYKVTCNGGKVETVFFSDTTCTAMSGSPVATEQTCKSVSYGTTHPGSNEATYYIGYSISNALCVSEPKADDSKGKVNSGFNRKMRNVLRSGNAGKGESYSEYSSPTCSGEPDIGQVIYKAHMCLPTDSDLAPGNYKEQTYQKSSCNGTFIDTRIYTGKDCGKGTLVESLSADMNNDRRSFLWGRQQTKRCNLNAFSPYAPSTRDNFDMFKYGKVVCSDATSLRASAFFAVISTLLLCLL